MKEQQDERKKENTEDLAATFEYYKLKSKTLKIFFLKVHIIHTIFFSKRAMELKPHKLDITIFST